jgi:predicted MPP superfamily phosphohydrolase
MVSLGRFYVFFFAALIVYGAALLCIARRIARLALRRRGTTDVPSREPSRAEVWVERGVYVLAALGVILLAYAFVEPYWPEVVRVRIQARGLARDRPIRIVQLSDLHCDSAPRLETRLGALVASLKPDLIVFTGDAINDDRGAPDVFRACMADLARVAPVYAVRGNWDVWWFGRVDLYGGTGARLLENEALPVSVVGQEIWVAGVSVDSEFRIPDVLSAVPRDRFCLFLHHYPAAAGAAAKHGADVHLCGDTHGGQIRLPLLGELVRIHRGGVWMPTGLHSVDGMPLYVNRGIGMEGGHAPRVRFACRPEVTLIEVSAPVASNGTPQGE